MIQNSSKSCYSALFLFFYFQIIIFFLFSSNQGKSMSISKQTFDLGTVMKSSQNKQNKLHLTKHLQGDLNSQQCCSFMYSKFFGSNKCCCTWLDKSELFQASLAKGYFIFLFFFCLIIIYLFIN